MSAITTRRVLEACVCASCACAVRSIDRVPQHELNGFLRPAHCNFLLHEICNTHTAQHVRAIE
jgi:hypothetical protein